MTKKFSKRVEEPRSPKPPAAQEDTAYVVREGLDEQQERLKQRAAASRTPAPTAPAEQPAAPATLPSKPLAPLGALWPSSVPAQGEATHSQRPAPAQSAPSTLLTAVVAPAPEPTVPKTVNVTFTLLEPDAKQVALTGDFNGWATDATPMKRQVDGHWATTIALAPGRYQHKFVVDGQWIPDPLVHEHVWNEQGTLNTVIEVRA